MRAANGIQVRRALAPSVDEAQGCDVSELAIPTDRVDDADLLAPRRWDAKVVRRFMLTFGPPSSLFDLLGFALVIFVIRTARPCWRDLPSRALALASVGVIAVAAGIALLPWGAVFGFEALPLPVVGLVVGLTLAYLLAAEVAKHLFNRVHGNAAGSQGVTTSLPRDPLASLRA